MPVKTRSAQETSELHVVTGGGGFAGFSLGRKLAQLGHRVKLLDVKEPLWSLIPEMEFVQCDLRSYDDVSGGVEGADIVYHMASYGMSGREQLNQKLIEEVNIGGTENVIKACQENNVTRLVYTSTYNVVFGGQEIDNGDESLPYLADDKFTDHYSKTKLCAEIAVISANGTSTKNGETLHTCALRLAGVYGPGEQRHIPRIVSYLEQGLVLCKYGSPDSRVDFLHVKNLVQAHIKAGLALLPAKKHIAAGQAYFVSDGQPINNFEFFRPLFEGLGYKFPELTVPLSVVFYFAFLTELVHSVVGKIYNFQPLLTRSEVYKTGVTHTFSIKKAREELGYEPTIQNDLSGVLEYYQMCGHVRQQKQSSGLIYYVVNIVIGLLIAILILSFLPGVHLFMCISPSSSIKYCN